MPVELSVIIANYNSGQFLKECVNSVFDAYEELEVVVIDNTSSDDSLNQLISAFPDEPRLHIHNNTSNLGFAKACNTGSQSVSGQYLFYLNPDAALEKHAITEMLTVLKENLTVGMVGGMLLNLDGSEQAGGRRGIPTPWRSFVRAFGLSRLGKRYPKLFSDFLHHTDPVPELPIEVEAISGACMMVRREALDDVGPLDEGYFMHCEDLDWCMRFRQKGWKILFVPTAKIVHYLGVCSKSRPIFVEWHKHKGMMRFYKKFFRHQYPGILMWLVGLGVWLRFGLIAIYYSGRHVARWLGLLRA